jgi:hypothetical protein
LSGEERSSGFDPGTQADAQPALSRRWGTRLPHSTGMTRQMRHFIVPLLERAPFDGSTDDVL